MSNENFSNEMEVAEKMIHILESLELGFKKAGELALSMQNHVKNYNKLDTGNDLVDIVTEADLAIQEVLLTEISKTDLRGCRLLGEENTPQITKFNEKGKLYLSIDPIDGTKNYAENSPYWSLIIMLHNGEDIIYLFNYFPAFNYLQKISNKKFVTQGNLPDLPSLEETKNLINYWSGSPEQTLPQDTIENLTKKGFIFKNMREMSFSDSAILFAENRIAGAYAENPNAYDGIVNLAIAKAKKLNVYTSEDFNLSNIQKRKSGYYYPGYYLVLN
jgi:fructose-1,6-bisphosphatase/inositol monophosphatase family enzyme